MRALLALIVFLLVVPLGFGQNYKPKPGETVMKLEIEGRGNVFIKLFTDKAPQTTSHIIKLVKDGFYNGQRFHRVEKSPKPYLAQVGDPGSKSGDLANVGAGGSGEHVPYEDTGVSHAEGVVGLVRSNVNDRNSGDSQFYITLGPAKFLDGKYTVFGQVAAGMEIAQKIERGDRITSAAIITG